ncbi:hypothetical protein AAHE18_13G267700 [Arachis hypogaea]
MSLNPTDGDSIHTPTPSKGGQCSNYSSQRPPASNTRKRSTSRFEFSKPPVTVQVRSPTPSDSTPSCARRPNPHPSNSLPRRTDAHPCQSAARTESSCAGVANECRPVSLSVVTSVFGLNKKYKGSPNAYANIMKWW